MNRIFQIIINLIVILLIMLQVDEYQHQLAYQFKGLLLGASVCACVVAYHVSILLHEYLKEE